MKFPDCSFIRIRTSTALGLPAPQEQGTGNDEDFGQLGTPDDIASSIAAWQAANLNATTAAPVLR
uniref:Putative secretory peptide no signal peptide n=1 Tax=Argas monolakensis TaxID=34602 RepID=Q09JT1_ARGMO|nr:putative secretory peptide no signal peptide [Argas monolakensis]